MDKQIKDIERAVRAGDANAFRQIVEAYERPVFAFVRAIVVEQTECEDVAQDVFLAAFQNLHRYDAAKGRFITWLITIARNKAINSVQRRRPKTGVEFSEPADPARPEDRLVESELKASFDRALRQLSLEQRTAFVLTELQGLSYQEASRIEGVAVGTIKSRVARARRGLQSAIRQRTER